MGFLRAQGFDRVFSISAIKFFTIADVIADILSSMIPMDEIRERLLEGEGYLVEFKEAPSSHLEKDFCAFAVQETKILFDKQLYVKEKAKELLSVRQIEIFRQRAHLEIDMDNMQLLSNIGCLQRQNGNDYLTHAGILLFGATPQMIFPQATVTLLVMDGPATILEQKILKGTLFQQVEEAFQFLKDHLQSKPEIDSLQRRDVLEIPEFVLRELLVNAVIYRDYFETSADVAIKIFPSFLEFSNPGPVSQRISLDHLWGKSFRRNPMIANVFFRANYIERAGTGLL